MPRTSYPRWTGPPPDGAAAESSAAPSDTPTESASWMTTNGPLLVFDLVRVSGNTEDDSRSPGPGAGGGRVRRPR